MEFALKIDIIPKVNEVVQSSHQKRKFLCNFHKLQGSYDLSSLTDGGNMS
jgi:hypothetical protein